MASGDDQGESKAKAQARFFGIMSEMLLEEKVACKDGKWDLNSSMADALKLVQGDKATPKYFSAALPTAELLQKCDARVAETAVAGDDDELPQKLFGDFFNLNMALKPQPGVVPTKEDPNFDPQRLEKFFSACPQVSKEAALDSLSTLISSILEQGCEDLAVSPAKLRFVLMALEHPMLMEPTASDTLKKLWALIAELYRSDEAQDILKHWYSRLPLAYLEATVSKVQQFLTLEVLMAQAEHGETATTLEVVATMAQTEDFAKHIRNALRLLGIVFKANELRKERAQDWKWRRHQQLMRQRGEEPDEEDKKFLGFATFHNDALNDNEGLLKHDLKEILEANHNQIELFGMEEESRKDFGLVEMPFVLTPVSKVRMLSIDALIMQREEMRSAMFQQILGGRSSVNPFLVLTVRRDQVIADALRQLASFPSSQFRKPLKVIFDGEQGVDEGGVQKEFFQLLMEELYNEDFGMFERCDESRNFWFNKNSFEANLQFELFGIVLGLAIYNQVILDVKFPMVLYKKLMGETEFDLSDLLDFQPMLAKGLIQLLEHEPASSVQEVFGPLNFIVEYERFGETVEEELAPGGKDMPVTGENRHEYVRHYCNWIFNTSIKEQFAGFKKGFDHCIGDTLFRQLFHPEELELVICGQMELDFTSLEGVTSYQDGFDGAMPIMRWFWEVIHELPQEEKKNFLHFCTGSDRAPVGGLGRLPFTISRHGPDSELLPSAHTCFNHLLIPEYASKEKLERCLRIAIAHRHGFGLM